MYGRSVRVRVKTVAALCRALEGDPPAKSVWSCITRCAARRIAGEPCPLAEDTDPARSAVFPANAVPRTVARWLNEERTDGQSRFSVGDRCWVSLAGGVALASAAHAASKTGAAKAGGRRAVPQGLRLGRGDGRLPGRGGRRPRTARGRRCGTCSARRRARSSRATPATSPATTTTATRKTSRCMKALGVKSYRFSVSWPRVLPDGDRRRPTRRGSTSTAASSTSSASTASTPFVHDLPLGLPAGAVQAGRLAEPRLGRLVRRVHERCWPTSSRTGSRCG